MRIEGGDDPMTEMEMVEKREGKAVGSERELVITPEEVTACFEESFVNIDGDMVPYPRFFFNRLGRRIRDLMGGIRIIGEIEPRRDTFESLAETIRTFVRKGWSPGKSSSPEERAVLSFFLVLCGIYHYSEDGRGDFWPHVFKCMELPHTQTRSKRLGEGFIACLRENDLEEFADVGGKYRTRILLHGLIPQRFVDQFMEKIILEELKSSYARFLTGSAIVNRYRGTARLSNLPRPIERFIEYGYPVNESLIDRVLELLSLNGSGSSQSCGLPRYMREAIVNVGKRKAAKRIGRISGGRSNLAVVFDICTHNAPVLKVPEEMIEELGGRMEVRQTDPDLPSVPVRDPEVRVHPATGWEILIKSGEGILPWKSLSANLPKAEGGGVVPLFFFSDEKSQMIPANRLNRLPTNFTVIYPHTGEVELTGGRFITEPYHLEGEWEGYVCRSCELEGEAILAYQGPSLSGSETVCHRFNLVSVGAQPVPRLTGKETAPGWLTTPERAPVFTYPSVDIVVHGGEPTRWNNWSYKLVDEVRGHKSPWLPLEFQEREGGLFFYLDHEILPGRYEVVLRGPVGIEDIHLPFVYLPLHSELCERKNSDEFRLVLRKEMGLGSDNGQITVGSDGKEVFVKVPHDNREPFCKVEFATSEQRETEVLLARSDVRWKIDSDLLGSSWYFEPVELSVPQIEKIKATKVLVEVGQGADNRSKVSFVLKGLDGEETLMSCHQSRLRGYTNTWPLDLRAFASQLKNVGTSRKASLVLRLNGEEIELFTITVNHEFKDFSVTSLGKVEDHERLLVNWMPCDDDPKENLSFVCFPLNGDGRSQSVPIPSNSAPPVEVRVKKANSNGFWGGYLQVSRSLFGSTKVPESIKREPPAVWLRLEEPWEDWLEMPAVSHSEIKALKGTFCNMDPHRAMELSPWLFFLHLLHNGGNNAFNILSAMLGEETLKTLLPFCEGRVWEIKAGGSKGRRKMVVVSSRPNVAHLNALPPCQWSTSFAPGAEIELQVITNMRHMGGIGSRWRFLGADPIEISLMMPESPDIEVGEMDLCYFLEDVFCDAPQQPRWVSLRCRMPLEEVWENPASVALAGSFETGEEEDPHELMESLKRLLSELNQKGSKEYRTFMGKLVCKRFNKNLPYAISGAIAALLRFPYPKREKLLEHPTIRDAFQFLRDHQYQAFLRDLVISELLITWYWNREICRCDCQYPEQ